MNDSAAKMSKEEKTHDDIEFGTELRSLCKELHMHIMESKAVEMRPRISQVLATYAFCLHQLVEALGFIAGITFDKTKAKEWYSEILPEKFSAAFESGVNNFKDLQNTVEQITEETIADAIANIIKNKCERENDTTKH